MRNGETDGRPIVVVPQRACPASRRIDGMRTPHRAEGPPATRREWTVVALTFLSAFVLYALTAAHSTVSLDVYSANRASWIIATTGSPWTDAIALPELDHHPLREVWLREAPNGHAVIGRSPGVVAAGLPAYWIAAQLGFTEFSLLPGALTAAALMTVALLFLFLAVRERIGRRAALWAALAFGFTTPAWTVAANGIWPHTVTLVGITGMAWAAATRRWWLVGLFGGVTLWGRLHAAVIVAIVGLFLGWWRRRPGITVQVGALSALFLVLVGVWSRWMYGAWDPTASYDTTVFSDYADAHRLSVVNQAGMWIAPDRGILVWTPALLLLLPALCRSWRRLPDWSWALLAGGLAYTVLQAVLNRFSGGDTFYGYRLGLEFLACAAPALALSLPRTSRWERLLLGPVLGLQAAAMAVGAVTERPFTLLGDVWTANAFVEALRGNVAGLLPITALAVVVGTFLGRRWAASATEGPAGERDGELPLGAEVARGDRGPASHVSQSPLDGLDDAEAALGGGLVEAPGRDAGPFVTDGHDDLVRERLEEHPRGGAAADVQDHVVEARPDGGHELVDDRGR